MVALGGRRHVTDAARASLRNLLVTNYTSLSQRLARRLGSADVADDALQDTYLRLEQGSDIGPIQKPTDYLFRIALNIAADKRRAETRKLTAVEVDEILHVADESPDPARVAEARSDLKILELAFAELPERRRDIFKAVMLDNIPRRDIAKRLGISVRTVDFEVQRALEHGISRLQQNRSFGFESGPSESSTK